MNHTFKLTVNRHPDGGLQGRPYVTDEHGAYVCEGFKDEISVTRMTRLVEQANAAHDLLAACEAQVKELEEQVLALGWSSVEEYRKYHTDREAYPMMLAAITKAHKHET
jgi:hypothetical protein